MVRAAGFEPANCASAPAPRVYRTLGPSSSAKDDQSQAAIAGMSTSSTTLAFEVPGFHRLRVDSPLAEPTEATELYRASAPAGIHGRNP